jgi:hypothetical protein
MFPFNLAAEVSPEEAELRNWLKSNRETLAGRDPFEVASLAITCGFDQDVVCRTLCNFQDAMAGSHLDNRVAFKAWLTDRAVEEVQKMRADLERVPELDLLPLWQELVAYTVTGEAQ